jgi:3'(2'), 5'-bisphosphate nucleotidase
MSDHRPDGPPAEKETLDDPRKSDAELRILSEIAGRASKLVMEIYATDFAVELKGPNDPVTRADREANTLICEALADAFPEASVVAEENSHEDASELGLLLSRDRVFFVDPIDGTREFADRNGEFAVMIGLAVRGVAEVGVVTVPALGHTLFGRVGLGCFRDRGDGRVERLNVSDLTDPSRARAVVSRSHRSARLQPILERLGVTREVLCGSVGLKVARVVTGDADIYIHPTRGAKKWDACAPAAILHAAGGKFTDLDGNDIDYRELDLSLERGIAVTNDALHDAVIGASRGVMGPPARAS